MKTVTLVFGAVQNVLNDVALDLIGTKGTIITEEKTGKELIEKNDFHQFCNDRWKAPLTELIMNNIIDEVMKTDNDTVCVTSTTLVDKETRAAFSEKLTNNDIAVINYPVHCSLKDIFESAIKENTGTHEMVCRWETMGKEYSRQYVPNTDLQKAVFVERDVIENLSEISKIILGAFVDSGIEVVTYATSTDEMVDMIANTPFKIAVINSMNEEIATNIFWRYIAGYYNVIMVVTDDADDALSFRKVGIDSFSVCNPLSLKKKSLLSL